MGYRAPSADQVYRHALRLDGPISLTDKFGFSIVLVNDQSPTCREFLNRYCIDLCMRTSDRIRFVFFSDVDSEKFSDMALYRGGSFGLLRRVIYKIMGAVNTEDPEWSELTPAGFVPLPRIEDIQKVLSYECDQNTALPGAEEAMRFANRLGVGKFVPCVVVFSDVGETKIHVLPIGNMSPEELFDHLRLWIDYFYDANHERIEQWRHVEDEITKLAVDSWTSLGEISAWREKRLKKWNELKYVGEAIRAIENGDEAALKTITDPPRIGVDPSVLTVTSEFRRVAQFAQNSTGYHKLLGQAQRSVESAASLTEIEAALRKCQQGLPAALVPAYYDEALFTIEQARRSERNQVHCFWNKIQKYSPLSQSRHKSLRVDWRSLTDARGVEIKYERDELVDALGVCSISDSSNDIADRVLNRLAEILHVDPIDETFHHQTKRFRRAIEDSVRVTLAYMPFWFGEAAPPLSLREALPLAENIQRDTILAPHHARLWTAIEGRRRAPLKDTEAARCKIRSLISEDLETASKSVKDSDDILETSRAKSLALLQPLRRRLADEAVAFGKKPPATRKGPSADILARLHDALDLYDDTVKSIWFPYESDRSTIVITSDKPLGHNVVGIHSHRDAKAHFQEQLATIASSSQSYANEIQGLKAPGALAPPLTTRLVEALDREDVSPSTRSAVSTINADVDPKHAHDVIASLSHDELAIAASAFECHPTVTDLIVALGFYVAGDAHQYPARLIQHITHERFDVFMAHNSRDRDAVLSITVALRARGVYPWIDVEQLPPGRWVQDALQIAIPRCRSAAVFFGPHGLGPTQKVELRSCITRCIESDIPVIPVLLPTVAEIPPELIFLRELGPVRFVRGLDDEDALSRLVWGITDEKPAHAG